MVLALFVIPYYFSFLWVEDKRITYVKNDKIYPRDFNEDQNKDGDNVFEISEESDKKPPPNLKKRMESKVLKEYDDVNDN